MLRRPEKLFHTCENDILSLTIIMFFLSKKTAEVILMKRYIFVHASVTVGKSLSHQKDRNTGFAYRSMDLKVKNDESTRSAKECTTWVYPTQECPGKLVGHDSTRIYPDMPGLARFLNMINSLTCFFRWDMEIHIFVWN